MDSMPEYAQNASPAIFASHEGEGALMKLPGLTACALLALVAGCASQPKEPPRIMMQGFSIAAPNLTDWSVGKQTPELTMIAKPGRFTGETYVMQATVIKLKAFGSADELVAYVETLQSKELDPKRYRVFKSEVNEQKVQGQSCALSRLEAAERTATTGTGSPVNIMLETMSLICPHPKDPTRAIDMAYSHRHFPEDADPQFSDDAALLMRTLAFEPL
jgi:hypothetical protein